jgi:hypothetical protein
MDENLGTLVWLSDPGTYPVLLIAGTTAVSGIWYFFYNLKRNPDIRIRKDKRKSTIRWWGPS